MVNWEYLIMSYWNGTYHFEGNTGDLPVKFRNIDITTPTIEIINTLGDIGWEMAGTDHNYFTERHAATAYFFKRPHVKTLEELSGDTFVINRKTLEDMGYR